MEENNLAPERKSTQSAANKKILENPVVGSLVVPIAIVLIGALVIFGITKMLNSERNYRDLVQELQSKTFGNKWIAAYELSKKIATSQIPVEDIPYVVKVLSETYFESSQDPRTRDFVVVALGVLKSDLGLPVIYQGLKDNDANVRYHSLVALANYPKERIVDWSQVQPFLKHDDPGIRQVAVLALATHKITNYESEIQSMLLDQNNLVKYSAAMGLINFQNSMAKDVLVEILNLKEPLVKTKANAQGLDSQQVANLKIGVIGALQASGWSLLNQDLEKASDIESNQQVALRMKEALNKLKK